MMPRLLHPDRNADLERRPSPSGEDSAQHLAQDLAQDLAEDLELPRLVAAMAAGEPRVGDVCRALLLSPLQDPAEIRYRQAVLRDCLARPGVVEELDAVTAQALAAARDVYGGFLLTAESSLNHAVRVMKEFLPALRRLRTVADREQAAFTSEGFRSFFRTLAAELDDEFFAAAEDHLRRLGPDRAVLLSARLGQGNRGTDHRLRMPDRPHGGALTRLGLRHRRGLVYRVQEGDEGASLALSDLRNRGLALASDALTRAAEHIEGFLRQLHGELAFYRGCLRLHALLTTRGLPTCWPDPVDDDQPTLTCRGLYDASLALTTRDPVVGNDVDADGRPLIVVTGANRGGKSTFLRSVGLAHLMMQSGMFVPAESFSAQVRSGLFSHFRREEDAGTDRGKLDQELRRMSHVVDAVRPRALLLCNESFASTNDREGSEIARQVLEPLAEAGVAVIVVTHLFDLAHHWAAADRIDSLFLRAERRPDGGRTFRLVPGLPEGTGYADDLYRQVFGEV